MRCLESTAQPTDLETMLREHMLCAAKDSTIFFVQHVLQLGLSKVIRATLLNQLVAPYRPRQPMAQCARSQLHVAAAARTPRLLMHPNGTLSTTHLVPYQHQQHDSIRNRLNRNRLIKRAGQRRHSH
jgi:hypothetical protein